MFLIKKKNLPPPHHPDFKQFSGIALQCFYLRGLTCLISRFLASADSFDVWESVELRRNESGWTQSLGCTSLSQPCEEIWLFMFLYMLNVSTHLLHLCLTYRFAVAFTDALKEQAEALLVRNIWFTAPGS